MNIYEKLAKIRTPVAVIKKNRKGYGYTYVDEEEILAKITGLMSKLGVSLIPNIVPNSTIVEPYHYTKTKPLKDGKIYEEHVNEVMVHGDMEWIWVNNEDPNDRIIVPWAFVGSQSDASQGFGSALTYASRYFLLKYFNVATSDDDPDNWRKKQREAEDAEDMMIAEQIINTVHEMVTDHLAKNPKDRDKIIATTKKYAKENGKASANYYAITKSETATELLDAIKQICVEEPVVDKKNKTKEE